MQMQCSSQGKMCSNILAPSACLLCLMDAATTPPARHILDKHQRLYDNMNTFYGMLNILNDNVTPSVVTS